MVWLAHAFVRNITYHDKNRLLSDQKKCTYSKNSTLSKLAVKNESKFLLILIGNPSVEISEILLESKSLFVASIAIYSSIIQLFCLNFLLNILLVLRNLSFKMHKFLYNLMLVGTCCSMLFREICAVHVHIISLYIYLYLLEVW